MAWFKYRQRMSSGNGSWQYMEYFPRSAVRKEVLEEIEDYLENARELATWSEHFRGCDIVKVSTPPVAVAQAALETSRGKIRYHQRAVIRYTKLLRQLKAKSNKQPKTTPKSRKLRHDSTGKATGSATDRRQARRPTRKRQRSQRPPR